MKRMAVLLALVLCLMMAAAAMAETKVQVQATQIPATKNNNNNGNYYIKIGAQESFPSDTEIVAYIRQCLNSNQFKYTCFGASAYENQQYVDITQDEDSLTVEFDASFFHEDSIQKMIAFYYTHGDPKFIDYPEPSIVDDGKKVKVTFNHLTPVVFAWVPGVPPVAAPLEAPDMPSTGDSSSLPGLFVLLGMSMAALGAMKLRRREN